MIKRAVIAWQLLLLAAVAFGFDPGELNRVSFSNQTGYDIEYLFFSPADSDWWGPDILGSRRVLADGQIISFYVHYPEARNRFSVFAIDEAGDAYFLSEVEISDGQEALVEITLELYDPHGYDDLYFSELIITNATEADIWYLFLSPSDSTMWGVDILDDETIFARGDSFSILVPSGSDPVIYDLLGLDEHIRTMYRQVSISRNQDEWFVDISESDLR